MTDTKLCAICGRPENAINHNQVFASSIDAHRFTKGKPMTTKPTDTNRLGELVGKMEGATTDGDLRGITQDDIGDIYSWLLWASEHFND